MRRLATASSALGFFWAIGATMYVLLGVGSEGIRTRFSLADIDPGGEHVRVSLFSSSGVWVAGLLAGVTLLAGMPFGVALSYPAGQRATTWSAGLMLLCFAIITGATVGLFYLPCAVALLVAAAATGHAGGESRPDAARRTA